MNEENNRDHTVERDAVKGPIIFVSRQEAAQSSKQMKTGKNSGPSNV